MRTLHTKGLFTKHTLHIWGVSAVLGLTACQPAEYMSRSSPFYPGSYLDTPVTTPSELFDGFLDSSQKKTQTLPDLPLETRVRGEEDLHGPNASFIDFALPAASVQPAKPITEYGPHVFEMISHSQQDPQATSILTNGFQRSHYSHSQILGIPFTLSSPGQSYSIISTFSSDALEQNSWMVEEGNTDSEPTKYPSTSKIWKVARYLLFQGDDPISKTYRSTMNTLAKASDTPVQLFLGPKSGLKVDLDYNKARLTLRLPFFETISTELEYEHGIFENKEHSAVKLMMGINF
ncbi:MAG: hypothetical protein Q8L34_00985 [Candidatus Woesearchaeota archaeon]|nr:hypothetical protein [Candidatus Woesearchaeota archaeon]